MTDLNPQAKQMADESMVRNLAAQAQAIWPQEVPLIRRYPMPSEPRILDAGCGTGEASSRLAELFPRASVLGVDVIDAHLELARTRYARLTPSFHPSTRKRGARRRPRLVPPHRVRLSLRVSLRARGARRRGPRLRFEHQSIFELKEADGSFDLTVCRHVIHSIPHPERVLAELARVTRRGGRLHLIPEDYGMLHFQRGALDPRDFWHEVPVQFGKATETDLFIGQIEEGRLLRLAYGPGARA